MKIKTILLAGVCGIALSGCLNVPVGYGPNGVQSDLTAPNPGVRRDITFSVDCSTTENAGVPTDDWIVSIREQLAASGLFGRIEYTDLNSKGSRHYHFKIANTGDRAEHNRLTFGREAMTGLSICTLFLLPGWKDCDINCTMSYMVNGREVYSTSSAQTRRTYIWLPGMFVFPFIDTTSTSESALWYFIREIRNNRLNDIQ